MSGYIGPVPVPQGIQEKQSFTATSGQTTFNTNGYTDGAFINVFLNGVRLVNGTDYTATNGSDVVLASAASASDVLDFETFNSFSLVDQTFDNVTLKNPTHEDTDGGRESAVSFKGEQSGGEISTLAQIQASHDGTSDDQKGDLIFKTNDGSDNDAPTEAFRVDSGQNILVGQSSTTTPVSANTVGTALQSGGRLELTCDGNTPIRLNRKSSEGAIAQFREDGATVGSISSRGGVATNLILRTATGQGAGIGGANSGVLPCDEDGLQDDEINLGASGTRWDDIYATNGTIQTSDENEKQNIASLTSAEITAATAISKLFKTFKWKDKVAAKGDNARTHTGVVAQQVQTAMSDAGLDASKYAFWCSDTWWEKDVEVAAVEADEENGIEAKDAYTRTDTYDTKEEAPEGATERTRLGVRYPELLAFVGAATEQRLTSIEARLTALEG